MSLYRSAGFAFFLNYVRDTEDTQQYVHSGLKTGF